MRDPSSLPLVLGLGEILWDLLPTGRQLGGAPANFAYHAKALGARAGVISQVGDDELGRNILARLDAIGLDRTAVSIDPVHATGTVDVIVDPAGVPTYTIHENVAWDFLEASEQAISLARLADAICYGTLAVRGSSRAAIKRLVRETPTHCLRVFDINLRQPYYDADLLLEMLTISNVCKLNDEELPVVARLLHLEGEDCARALLQRFKLRAVALTRGAHGARLYTPGEVSDHPGFTAELADTVGAGDAYTAAVVLGLLKGETPERINAFANRLAAYVCSQAGATPAMPDEILAAAM